MLSSVLPAFNFILSHLTFANMKPVPLNCIKGYKVQYSDNCHIEAITFYMVANKQVCANLKAEWVRETLEILQYEMLTHI
uniref:Chemokine interleukin-8-like domain-containing protein n=1 Tax=Oreochromis niloticus TaxID=8128 RepID=A0A669BWU4_ORENI